MPQPSPCREVSRLLLADDHAVLRDGLRAILRDAGFEVVGEASDGHEAIRLCEELRPDIAVVDIAMPLLNGIDAARQMLKVSPETVKRDWKLAKAWLRRELKQQGES